MRSAVVLALGIMALVLAGCPDRAGSGQAGSDPSGSVSADAPPQPWPPVKGQTYPDLELEEAGGGTLRLSSLRGKVVLVEPIGVACPACNAYAGAEEKGAFRGSGVQQGLGSLEKHLQDIAQVRLDAEPDLVLVQLLLFDGSSSVGRAPTSEDARAWADHFGFAGRANVKVLRGTTALADQAGYAMVPGFQLIDRQGVLRYDGSGHHPQDDPYDTVLASVPALLAEAP